MEPLQLPLPSVRARSSRSRSSPRTFSEFVESGSSRLMYDADEPLASVEEDADTVRVPTTLPLFHGAGSGRSVDFLQRRIVHVDGVGEVHENDAAEVRAHRRARAPHLGAGRLGRVPGAGCDCARTNAGGLHRLAASGGVAV